MRVTCLSAKVTTQVGEEWLVMALRSAGGSNPRCVFFFSGCWDMSASLRLVRPNQLHQKPITNKTDYEQSGGSFFRNLLLSRLNRPLARSRRWANIFDLLPVK